MSAIKEHLFKCEGSHYILMTNYKDFIYLFTMTSISSFIIHKETEGVRFKVNKVLPNRKGKLIHCRESRELFCLYPAMLGMHRKK